ncbi:MAG TPA: MCP four helix bundle domain-containing protein, partial [Rhodocyclaceae bacterium]|nr:MCP four helix bundle domain-containing protein [Rhodocyclaceae bacterium]
MASQESKAFSIRARLYTLVVALLVVAAGLGLLGLNGMSRTLEGLQSVYEDRVVPLRDLKIISDEYAVAVVDAAHKVRDGVVEPKEAGANMRKAQQVVAERWTAFTATTLTPEEAALVERTELAMAQGNALIDRMAASLEKGWMSEINPIVA